MSSAQRADSAARYDAVYLRERRAIMRPRYRFCRAELAASDALLLPPRYFAMSATRPPLLCLLKALMPPSIREHNIDDTATAFCCDGSRR